ncbi:MAG: DUF7793 family protein [Bacteroidia bacterium]
MLQNVKWQFFNDCFFTKRSNFAAHPRAFSFIEMNKVRTSVAEMFIDDDGILRFKMLEGAHITLEKIKEYYEAGNRLAGNKKVLVLIDGQLNYTITDEAKKYSASAEAVQNRIAVAFVTNSVANRLVINLYIKFDKPVVPTKMFSSEAAALKWLKTFYIMPGDKFSRPKKK